MPKIKRKPSVGNKVNAPNSEVKPEYHIQDRRTPEGSNQDFKVPKSKPPKKKPLKID
jgi:hypothetical protein